MDELQSLPPPPEEVTAPTTMLLKSPSSKKFPGKRRTVFWGEESLCIAEFAIENKEIMMSKCCDMLSNRAKMGKWYECSMKLSTKIRPGMKRSCKQLRKRYCNMLAEAKQFAEGKREAHDAPAYINTIISSNVMHMEFTKLPDEILNQVIEECEMRYPTSTHFPKNEGVGSDNEDFVDGPQTYRTTHKKQKRHSVKKEFVASFMDPEEEEYMNSAGAVTAEIMDGGSHSLFGYESDGNDHENGFGSGGYGGGNSYGGYSHHNSGEREAQEALKTQMLRLQCKKINLEMRKLHLEIANLTLENQRLNQNQNHNSQE